MLIKFDKIIKVTAITLLTICLLISISSISNAGIWNPITPSDGLVNQDTAKEIETTASTVVSVMKSIGYVIAVIMLMYIGIKYITASPDGKAEVKNKAVIFVIGAILIASSVTIVDAIYATTKTTQSEITKDVLKDDVKDVVDQILKR